MVEYIHYKDPNSKEMAEHLRRLVRFPGTCIFIDIVNSTGIKYSMGIEEWGIKVNNTFNFLSFLNDFPDNIVKGIGDEIMLFIPDTELVKKTTYTDYFGILQELYATLDNIKNFPLEDVFLHCKVAIHYCADVYNISFLKGANDYYGRDIDLTARLMIKAKPHRIVMTEVFYEKVRQDYQRSYSHAGTSWFEEISGKYIEDFKGVPVPTEFRILSV